MGRVVVFVEIKLAILQETRDRTDVATVKLDVPFVPVEITIRNSGVVLENHLAVGQEITTHLGEIIRMHKVRRRLQQAHAHALLLAKLAEVRIRLDAPVREVGGEVVERLRASGWTGEHDPGSRRGPFSFRNKCAGFIERDELDRVNRAAGAGEENVKDRQSSADLLLSQIDLHVFGDEKAEAEDRIE